MRRIYLLVLAVVLVATLVGLAISEQAGYVLIAYKSFRYESSLWSFLALLAVVWLLVVLVRLVLRLLGSSGEPGSRARAGRPIAGRPDPCATADQSRRLPAGTQYP